MSEMNKSFRVGENIFIRTVCYIITGKLVAVYPTELVLVDAAWIAETERYADSVRDFVFREVEPYPDGVEVIIGRGSIVEAFHTKNALPREQR